MPTAVGMLHLMLIRLVISAMHDAQGLNCAASGSSQLDAAGRDDHKLGKRPQKPSENFTVSPESTEKRIY